jgi:hypothetical protein
MRGSELSVAPSARPARRVDYQTLQQGLPLRPISPALMMDAADALQQVLTGPDATPAERVAAFNALAGLVRANAETAKVKAAIDQAFAPRIDREAREAGLERDLLRLGYEAGEPAGGGEDGRD